MESIIMGKLERDLRRLRWWVLFDLATGFPGGIFLALLIVWAMVHWL